MQLNCHTIPVLQNQYYGIHEGINNLLYMKFCNDIIKIDLRCCSYIWDVAVSLYRVYLNESTVNPQFKWFYCIMHVQNMGFTFLIMVPFPSVS